MKLSLAILASTAALASGKRSLKDIPSDMSNVQIKAESKTGNRLLSKARRLDGDGDITWIAGYSIKFQHCTSFQDYYNGNWQEYAANYNYNQQNNQQYNENYQNYQNGGEQYQNYNQNQNQDGNMDYYNGNQYANNGNQDYQGMYQQHLVHFKLCPSDSCFRCKNGADYVVELEDFIQATLDAKLSAQEYACEKVKDNCYCENAYSEDQCLYSCYTNAKLTECANAMYEEEFDMEDAIQCTELETDDEDAVKQFYYQSARNGDMAYYGEEEEQEGSMYVGPCKSRQVCFSLIFVITLTQTNLRLKCHRLLQERKEHLPRRLQGRDLQRRRARRHLRGHALRRQPQVLRQIHRRLRMHLVQGAHGSGLPELLGSAGRRRGHRRLREPVRDRRQV
ncbi:hypothetical protein ACHAWF_009270 [Thalassiosira exigua]